MKGYAFCYTSFDFYGDDQFFFKTLSFLRRRKNGHPRQSRNPDPSPTQHHGNHPFFAAIVLLSLVWRGVEMLTDWWWFQEVGYESVFWITFLTQMKMAALFGLAFFVIFYLNLFLANRFSKQGYWVDRDELIHIPPWEAGNQPLGTLILVASVLFSLFAALRGSAHWEVFLQYFNATPFQISDPLFNRDVGFYVFQIPFLKMLYGWLMTVLAITTVASGLIYFLRRSFQVHPLPRLSAWPRQPGPI